jgi:hypothetical protein
VKVARRTRRGSDQADDLSRRGALLGGVSWQAAAQQGLFDGARVSVDKVFMPEPGDTSLGLVNLFAGRVADVDADRVSIELTCKSDVELLDTPFPRNVYQPNVRHTLFDYRVHALRAGVHDRDGRGIRIDREDPERSRPHAARPATTTSAR